jgi:pimeloyl-ACP methyl ester carboxylesterase
VQRLQESIHVEAPVEPDGGNVTQGARREWTATVNGTGLRVEEAGGGAETVVFSPALFTNRALFDAPVAALSGDHRCIRYDHRGQGDSGLGARQPSRHLLGTEGLYDDAVALLDQLGVESCHWVGASVGGFVGVRLAARLPGRVRSLTLIGFSTRRVPSADLRQIDLLGWMVRVSHPLGPVGAAVRRRVTEQVMRNMFGTTFMSDPSRADDREKWRQRFMATIVPEAMPMLREVFGHPGNPPELLTRIQAPTLIIAGEDELAALGEAYNDPLQAQRVIPGARLITIPGAGHMVLVEQPEAGTAAIASFIRDVSAAQPATGGSST